MSDNGTSGLTTDAAPPSATVVGDGAASPDAAPPGSVGAGAPPAPADLLAEPPADRAVFDRGYVESIRREAQRYRGEAQRVAEYDDVFAQYEPQDRDVWFNLARTWATNPEQAARVMQQIANGVLGDQMQASMDGGNIPEPVEADERQPEKSVQEQIEEAFRSREQRAQEQAAVDNVMKEVRDLGFDPDSAEGFMVLWNANHQTNGDIKKAADMVRGYRQQVIDEYVQGRSSGRVPMPTRGGAPATATDAPITNLEDARKATVAFLRERRGA